MTETKDTTKPAASAAAQAAVKPTNTDKTPPDTNVDANAGKQVLQSGGSPANTGSTDEDKGKGGTVATEGNKSPTTVASKLTDNSPATGPGGHANIAGATQDPKDPAVVKSEDVAGKTEQLDLTKGVPDSDPEFERALKEPDSAAVSEADLDDLDRREHGKTLEELKQEREELDKQISVASRENEKPNETVSRQQSEHERTELNLAFNKLVKLDSVVLPSTPDSHIAWGVGGVILTLGDLRKIARAYVKNGSRV